jgi:hypothetical protein
MNKIPRMIYLELEDNEKLKKISGSRDVSPYIRTLVHADLEKKLDYDPRSIKNEIETTERKLNELKQSKAKAEKEQGQRLIEAKNYIRGQLKSVDMANAIDFWIGKINQKFQLSLSKQELRDIIEEVKYTC